MVIIVSHIVRRLAAAVLLRVIKDASGNVGECPKKRMRAFYQKDAVEFFAGGDYEYWAVLAGVSIPTSVLAKLTEKRFLIGNAVPPFFHLLLQSPLSRY